MGGKVVSHPVYFEFTVTNRMAVKNLWAEIFGPEIAKICYF